MLCTKSSVSYRGGRNQRVACSTQARQDPIPGKDPWKYELGTECSKVAGSYSECISEYAGIGGTRNILERQVRAFGRYEAAFLLSRLTPYFIPSHICSGIPFFFSAVSRLSFPRNATRATTRLPTGGINTHQPSGPSAVCSTCSCLNWIVSVISVNRDS